MWVPSSCQRWCMASTTLGWPSLSAAGLPRGPPSPRPQPAVASSPHLALPKVVSQRELWRCAACQLSHIDLLHLLFNLSALWSIGEGLPGTPRTASPQGGAPRTPGNRAALRSARSH